jgi:transcriptional regulator GlxA family with amidase domain
VPPVRDVVVVVFDRVQSLDVTGPCEVFAGANAVLDAGGSRAPRYRLHVVSTTGGEVATEAGLRLVADPIARVASMRPDMLLLPGGFGVRDAARDQALVDAVAALAARCERVVTVCSGSFLAAAAGLLDGRTVTTHWARAAQLQAAHPSVRVDADPIYVRDGNVWSSAGVTAGIDLALALVEHDHDAQVAQTIARWLVMFLRRPGGQTQFATAVWTRRADDEPVRRAQSLVEADPGDDHRVDRLAARVGMSERHFIRRFTAGTGTSPARYVADVRLEAARRELEQSDDTVETIARRCGFGTGETLRRTFARRLGVTPDAYRRRFTTTTTTTTTATTTATTSTTATSTHPS